MLQVPLEIAFHNIESSDWAEQEIRARVAELERQLAEDWTNVDLVAAHRAAREDLAGLLTRWESLFGD